MKTRYQDNQNLNQQGSFRRVCAVACEKLLNQLNQVKANIQAEFQGAFGLHKHLLRQALVEADALAWQTDYPHLFFPELATEKASQAADWRARQQAMLRQRRAVVAFAA
ncbi:MAG TPA: hypothetical protein VFF11_01560 [Candidatus Binatia bacterium]|nr:hypothetical protein [Candidatus Binatia bacterium]